MSSNPDFNRPTLPAMGWVTPLKEEDRDLLASYGDFMAGPEGKVIIQAGTEQRDVYLVISGTLEVLAEVDGTETVVGSITEGESFGEVAVFDPGPASATVRGKDFAQIWHIDKQALEEFSFDNPVAGNHLLIGLATCLSQRLRGTTNRLAQK